MVKNGNMIFLLYELILPDQLADLNPLVQASSGEEWQYEISTVRVHIGRSTGISSNAVKISNFTFLLLELTLADQLADLTPQVKASSGQEWQYEISTVRVHIDISTGISSNGKEWQFNISTVRTHIGRSTGRSYSSGT